MKRKLCVLFPGIGYTVDKPLLYYSGKYFKKLGYEIISIKYSELPPKVVGDADYMKKAFMIGLKDAQEQLSGINWQSYEEIIFVGKSIGTAISAAYAVDYSMEQIMEHSQDQAVDSEREYKAVFRNKLKIIYFTPLIQTFYFVIPDCGIAFHGNSDPWAESAPIRKACKELGIPLYEYKDANHSLDTGDIIKDIGNLKDIMKIIMDYVQ